MLQRRPDIELLILICTCSFKHVRHALWDSCMKNRYLGLEIMKSMGPDHCIPGSTVHCFSPRSSCFIHGHCAHFERA